MMYDLYSDLLLQDKNIMATNDEIKKACEEKKEKGEKALANDAEEIQAYGKKIIEEAELDYYILINRKLRNIYDNLYIKFNETNDNTKITEFVQKEKEIYDEKKSKSHKVNIFEDGIETAKKGIEFIKTKKTAFIAGAIIIAVAIGAGSCAKGKGKTNKGAASSTISMETLAPTEEPNSAESPEVVATPSPTAEINSNISQDNNYDNAKKLYQDIMTIRNDHPDFANAITSEQDVINIVNWLNLFNTKFAISDSDLKQIPNYDEVKAMLKSYYTDCVKYGITPEINILCNDADVKNAIKRSEDIASNMTANKSYDDENAYYIELIKTWIIQQNEINLGDKKQETYAVVIDAQYEVYRYDADMLNARKYQKNNVLDINSDYNLTCPDGVDDTLVGDEKGSTSMFELYEDDLNNTQSRVLGK